MDKNEDDWMAEETAGTTTADDADDPATQAAAGADSGASGGGAETDEIQQLIAERDRALQEKTDLFDRLQRAQAEFENARRRMSRETTDAREYAAMNTVDTLLPVMDDFDRALAVEGIGDDVRKGFEMIRKRMADTFERLGLRPVATDGKFDPNLHEAVDRLPVDNPDEDQNIVAVLQQGYYFKERLLRAALVRVAVAD